MFDYFYNITKIEASLWGKEHIGVTISNLKLGLCLEGKKKQVNQNVFLSITSA